MKSLTRVSFVLGLLFFAIPALADNDQNRPIPVIFDTDIGSGIDDTWALAFLLQCPELDVKLVVSDTGDTIYRAKIIAKMIEAAGRTDIPVGIGTPTDVNKSAGQREWVKDYDLESYPGVVLRDGVGAIIDVIMKSAEPVTLICVGPVPNIDEALKREPRITLKTRFVGMHGSVYKGYRGSNNVSKEANVCNHTSACQKVLSASWDITVTPLDTCGLVVLDGAKYAQVKNCDTPLMKALMENYAIWRKNTRWFENSAAYDTKSSILFDTVAVYLAFSEELLTMKKLPVRVTDDGYMVIDETAKKMNVAIEWKDMEAFENLLVNRLTGKKAVHP